MATFPIYDPQSSEALSSPIGGMSNAVSLISIILNMGTSQIVDFEMSEIFIDDSDRYRLYTVPTDKRGWINNPAPIIKKNGTIITEATHNFKVHLMGGCIEFLNESNRPVPGDIITVTATYINGSSEVITKLQSDVATLISKLGHFRGSFDTLAELEQAITDSKKYDYAYVFGTTFDIFFSDGEGNWVPTDKDSIDKLQIQINALETGKEPKITNKGSAFNKNFGTTDDSIMRGSFAYSKEETNEKISTVNQNLSTHINTNDIHRKIYIQEAEPTDASENDIWIQI